MPGDQNYKAFLYSDSISKKIDEICTILKETFNIHTFGHVRIFKDNSYIIHSNSSTEFLTHYIQNLRSIEDDIFKLIPTMSYTEPYFYYWNHDPNADKVTSLLYESDIWNGHTIFQKNKEYLDAFVFATKRTIILTPNFYRNIEDKLFEFVRLYKVKFFDQLENLTVNKRAYYKKKVDFDLSEPSESAIKMQNFLEAVKTYAVFDKNGKIYFLSKREFECMSLLKLGKTIKGISSIVDVGDRAVESYLNSVKLKTGLKYKADLLDLLIDPVNKI